MKVLGWYVVSGYADISDRCLDKNNAGLLAEKWNETYVETGPHRAVLLAEIDESEIPQEPMGE